MQSHIVWEDLNFFRNKRVAVFFDYRMTWYNFKHFFFGCSKYFILICIVITKSLDTRIKSAWKIIKKYIMHLQNHSTTLCKQQQYYIFICRRQVLKYQYHFELRKTSESIHTAVILITTTWIQISCQNWNGFFSTKPY